MFQTTNQLMGYHGIQEIKVANLICKNGGFKGNYKHGMLIGYQFNI